MTTEERTKKNGESVLLGRLISASLLAWAGISFCLSIYVLRTYPSDDTWGAVAGRQFANWMPFSVYLPALWATSDRMRSANRGRLARSLAWVALGVVLLIVYAVLRQGALTLLSVVLEMKQEDWGSGLSRMWPIAVIIYCVITSVSSGVQARAAQQRAESAARKLEVELSEARLHALEAQLRPHFLFNTLQAIEDSCWEDSESTSRMVLDLSELLRASLESEWNGSARTLGDELGLARKYIALQKARFGDRIRFEEEIDAAALGEVMPPLFFQPLLENAVTHGIELLSDGGLVQIVAQVVERVLVVQVINEGPVDRSKSPHEGFGIGFENTTARLQALRGKSASITITERAGGGAIVEARVPLRSHS